MPGWLPGTRSSSQPLARWPCRIAGASIWAAPRVAICRRAPQGRSTANTFGERLGRDILGTPSVKGNHPQMAESFRLVKYFDLPKFLEVLGSFFFWVFGSFSVTGTGEMEGVASLATINWLVAPIWDFLGMGGCSYHFFQNYILVWKSGMTKTHSDTCLVFSSGWGNPRMKHMGGQIGLNVYIYIYILFDIWNMFRIMVWLSWMKTSSYTTMKRFNHKHVVIHQDLPSQLLGLGVFNQQGTITIPCQSLNRMISP